MIKIALVDDHAMLRNGLAEMLTHKGFDVLFEAGNGKECIEKLDEKNLPDIILMDINMPQKNGYETTEWLQHNQPTIKVLALSMYDSDDKIIKMLRAGARGYMLKDSASQELVDAIQVLHQKGFYTNDMVSGKMIKVINSENDLEKAIPIKLTEREIDFLKLCCTELGYKEMAIQLNISPRTIDGYREILFEKLNIHTRVGLVVYAIKNGLVIV